MLKVKESDFIKMSDHYFYIKGSWYFAVYLNEIRITNNEIYLNYCPKYTLTALRYAVNFINNYLVDIYYEIMDNEEGENE